MTAPVPTDKVKDKEYLNWLKVTLALYYMKSGLHTFIQSEVDSLHQSLVQKIYGGKTVPLLSCTTCDARLVRRNRQCGVWTFPERCNSCCCAWFRELLALHISPHSKKIYWENSDVTLWPFKPWECAKIFMPRGQQHCNVGPAECDVQALMTLLVNCQHFSGKLSKQSLDLTHRISTIRNNVMHDGEMKLSDAQRSEYIQQIIQLLEDPNSLKSTEDCKAAVGYIQKIDNDSLDVLFNLDIEMTGLRSAVNDIRLKLGMQEKGTLDTVDSLKEEYKQFRQQLTDVENRLETIEKDVQAIKKKQTIHQEMYTAVTSHGVRFHAETPVKRRPKTHGQRQLKKTPIKRRPETDGLRQLKNQTEDKLDTVKRLKCIPTTQQEEAKKLLEGRRSIVIKGNPGEGKTMTALHLIDNEIYRNRRLVVYCPSDWKRVDTDWVDIVVLEDMFGQFDLDLARLQEWMVYLPTIQEHVDAGKLQVIITTRVDILSKAYSKLGSIKLFSDDLSLTLSSKQLRKFEKMSILSRELQRHDKNMKEDEKENCIANFCGLIGFPQCCSLFAGDSNLFNRGSEFFKSPEKLFVDNISKLEATRFLSLAFLFCNGTICEEYLSPETMPESSKRLLMELASHLNISERKASVTLLRDVYDSCLGLYIVKSLSREMSSGVLVEKPCIWFSHATVYEAVGHVLGDYCLEMVIKYGDSKYLCQRTYTAEEKVRTSQNVFIPASLYGLLAQQMIHVVVEEGLVENVVRHSALKQHQFLMKLKDELHRGNRIRDFFMNKAHYKLPFFSQDLSEGECITFFQYLLRSDEDVVTFVYNKLLEFLVCKHSNNSSDCWQCEEKQKLLELALYYKHFEIADKLITMNACYTHISLCNVARHGNLKRVQSILETLKTSHVFNSICDETKEALCRAYISGNQGAIEFFLKEGITLDSRHVGHVVRQGDMNALLKVTEHLKYHNNWNPHLEKLWTHWNFLSPLVCSGKYKPHEIGEVPLSMALYIAYCNEEFDMADYLVKHGVKVSMDILPHVLEYSSQKAVARLIQSLKHTGAWDPNCYYASEALQIAYSKQKYDVCDLLIHIGVSLTVENLHGVIRGSEASFDSVMKAIQHLQDTHNWDPLCDDAIEALQIAYRKQKYDVCDLLVQEGVSVAMKNLHGVIKRSLDHVTATVQQLKDTENWNPKCEDASKALECAYCKQKYDVCELLVLEGVSLAMKNLCGVIGVFEASFESAKKAIQHLKDTDSWDPRCDGASQALEKAYSQQKYDVCDLLVQDGVSLTMKHLTGVIRKYQASFESVTKVIQHLKDTDNWDPKCDDASDALENAYRRQKIDVCELLVQEGVSIAMKHLPGVVCSSEASFESVKKAIQHLKDSDNWYPKSVDASKSLENAYKQQKYDVCELLVQEGVSITMKHLPALILFGSSETAEILDTVKKIIQHMKDNGNWDAKCNEAFKALQIADNQKKYDVCNLLVQEGVSLTMKNLPGIICGFEASFESVMKAIQHLKDTDNWHPNCDDASDALENAYRQQKIDVCELLVQEGVSIEMKHLPGVVCSSEVSFESVKKAIQHLKDTHNWDPKCGGAFEALENAYRQQKYDICELLVQEGVLIRMKHLPGVVSLGSSEPVIIIHNVRKIIQQLKDTENWDPDSDFASEALQIVHTQEKYDVCDLLVQEGVSLRMKNLLNVICGSFESVKRAVQHMKDTRSWDPLCDDAFEALETAYRLQRNDVCDLLVQEGVSITMRNLHGVILKSLDYVKTTVQQLKDTENWNPKCEDASKALECAYSQQKYDVCDLLVQEGVSLTMKNLHNVIMGFKVSFETVEKVIQHLKNIDNWYPKSDTARQVLENAYGQQKFDVCGLLVQEGVALTMKNLPSVIWGFESSFESIRKVIQHLKDTDNWDQMCDDASTALGCAYSQQRYVACYLLVQEGVSLIMKHLPVVICGFKTSSESIRKAVQHLKDTHKMDPLCDDASDALGKAYSYQKYDVCDLLVQEGVSLTMKNLPGVIYESKASFESVKKVIQHLKDTDNWDPKCDDASKALNYADSLQKYDVRNLLVQEGVLPFIWFPEYI